ncbi:MAG TPA: pirin-like C-terminal cupin domain-containing protein, partial [bacterium]|nr:pirin-like C-terminal cupin domain-containing protein [bacterium]
GLAWGYQLWLNLAAKHKMVEPKYQDLPSEKLPVVEKDGARVKVLAGEYGGAKSPGVSYIPFSYFDVTLTPGARFEAPAPKDQNAFLYVFEGKAKTGAAEDPSYVKTGYLGVFGPGDRVRVEAAEGAPARFLFASAQRLGEPVARGGPFVMNTVGEVKKAFLDYQTGQLG